MLAGRYHGCNCVRAAVNAAVSAQLFAKWHVVFYTTVFLLPLSATHGANRATWSSGHAICEDSGSAVFKESGIMMWDGRKEP